MLGDVREALRHDVVRRNLERFGKAPVELDRQAHGHGRPRNKLLERDFESVTADDRRMKAAGDLAQLGERVRDLAASPVDAGPDFRIVAQPRTEHAEIEGERDQPLLRTVVEVALEQLPLSLCRLDDPRPGPSQLLEPGSELRVQPGVLERDSGRRPDRVEQLGLLLQRRIVDQRGHMRAAEVDRRRGPAVEIVEVDRVSVDVGVGAVIGEPIGELQRRVAERTGKRVAQVAGCRIRRQLQHEVSHGRATEACIEQREQEDDRREPDNEQRGALDRQERAAFERSDHAGDEEHGDHQQAERERVDEQRDRATEGSAGSPAPRNQDADADQAAGGERQELDPFEELCDVRLHRDLEQVVGTEVDNGHLEWLQTEGRRVGRGHEPHLEPRPQTPVGEREVDVQEDCGRQEVEECAERVGEVMVGELERGQAAAEPAGDHQRPESAVRTAPPGHQARADVRQRNPCEQRDLDPADVLVRQAIRREARGHGEARDGDRREDAWARLRQSAARLDVDPCSRRDGHGSSVLRGDHLDHNAGRSAFQPRR